jgi:hypothetical protein
MRYSCLCLCFAAAFAVTGLAQQSAIIYLEKPLTNHDVIAFLEAGFSNQVIIARIQASPSNFDTTAEGLRMLQEAGAADRLLMAILRIRYPGMSATELKLQLPPPADQADEGEESVTAEPPDSVKDQKTQPATSPPKQEVKYLGTTQVEKASSTRRAPSQPRSRAAVYPKKK